MEDLEFDAAIQDINEAVAAMTQVIDNIKALEHETDQQQIPIF